MFFVTILVILGSLLLGVGGIWGLVQAFSEDTVWGLLYLLVPFAAWVFYIKKWGNKKIRKSFYLQIGGYIALFLSTVITIVNGASFLAENAVEVDSSEFEFSSSLFEEEEDLQAYNNVCLSTNATNSSVALEITNAQLQWAKDFFDDEGYAIYGCITNHSSNPVQNINADYQSFGGSHSYSSSLNLLVDVIQPGQTVPFRTTLVIEEETVSQVVMKSLSYNDEKISLSLTVRKPDSTP